MDARIVQLQLEIQLAEIQERIEREKTLQEKEKTQQFELQERALHISHNLDSSETRTQYSKAHHHQQQQHHEVESVHSSTDKPPINKLPTTTPISNASRKTSTIDSKNVVKASTISASPASAKTHGTAKMLTVQHQPEIQQSVSSNVSSAKSVDTTIATAVWNDHRNGGKVISIQPPLKKLQNSFESRFYTTAMQDENDDVLEEDSVEAFVTLEKNRLKEILECIRDGSTSERTLQHKVNLAFASFLHGRGNREVLDTSGNAYLLGYQPSVSLKATDKPLSGLTVQAIGKLRIASKSFNDSHYGEAFVWLKTLLHCQPWRSTARCLMMDQYKVCILEIGRELGKDEFYCRSFSPIRLHTDDAVFIIDDFINGTDFVNDGIPREFTSVIENQLTHYENIASIQVLDANVKGALYKCVFDDEVEDQEFVVKLVQSNERFITELDALRILHDCDGVAKVLGCNSEKQALLLPWFGESLERSFAGGLTRAKFAQLVDTLEQLHDRHVIHRDISPSTIICSQNSFILADFGLCIVVDSVRPIYQGSYVGTPLYSPQAHLRNLTSEILAYNQSTDLQSLVKTWASLMFSSEAKGSLSKSAEAHYLRLIGNRNSEHKSGGIQNLQTETFTSMANDWDQIFQAFPLIKSANLSALLTDYDSLKSIFLQVPLFLNE